MKTFRLEPALIIGAIATLCAELAVMAQQHRNWLDFFLAAIPVISAAVIRTFVTPTDDPGL